MQCKKKYTQKEITEQGMKVHKAKQRWIKKTQGAPTEEVLKAEQSWIRAKKKLELMRHCEEK